MSEDIIPKHCELSEESLERIKNLIPKCKIIISLRETIERQWSRAKMNMLKDSENNLPDFKEESELLQFSDHRQHQCSDYV